MAILGIDEVGRGPLAGPLVVGAVILPDERPEWVEELKDSKKLTARKREVLSGIILKEALACGLGWVSAAELDDVGISAALRLATRRAVKSIQRLHVPFSQIVIDGKVNFLSQTPLEKYVTTVVKADDLIKEVSAASIVAKVARDKYMHDIALRYSGYDFEKNVGYGTAKHIAAVKELGITPEHRKSFEPIKSMIGFERPSFEKNVVKNTALIGKKGETAVCDFLKSKGHEIVAKNFKTYYYEIDIVSLCDGKIYFTEVKTRKGNSYGGGLLAVDKKKLQKMQFGAECCLKYHHLEFGDFDPLLAVASVDGEYNIEDGFPLD